MEQGFRLLLYQASRPSETTDLSPRGLLQSGHQAAHQSAGGMVILATIFTFISKFATAVGTRSSPRGILSELRILMSPMFKLPY